MSSSIAEGAIVYVNQTFTDPTTGEHTTNYYKMQYTKKGGWQVIDSDLPKAPLDDDTTLNDIKW